jgi:hypothetical protein
MTINSIERRLRVNCLRGFRVCKTVADLIFPDFNNLLRAFDPIKNGLII